jgi:hypothetical protein
MSVYVSVRLSIPFPSANQPAQSRDYRHTYAQSIVPYCTVRNILPSASYALSYRALSKTILHRLVFSFIFLFSSPLLAPPLITPPSSSLLFFIPRPYILYSPLMLFPPLTLLQAPTALLLNPVPLISTQVQCQPLRERDSLSILSCFVLHPQSLIAVSTTDADAHTTADTTADTVSAVAILPHVHTAYFPVHHPHHDPHHHYQPHSSLHYHHPHHHPDTNPSSPSLLRFQDV